MAVTVSYYNHTLTKIQNLDIDANASNFYVELLDSNASFTATDAAKTDVDNAGAYEVSGNGWTAGGENLASVTATTVNTDETKFDAADVVVTASSGNIGPADAALLYVDEGASGTTLTPLLYIDFGASRTALDGNDFSLLWDADGIYTIA